MTVIATTHRGAPMPAIRRHPVAGILLSAAVLAVAACGCRREMGTGGDSARQKDASGNPTRLDPSLFDGERALASTAAFVGTGPRVSGTAGAAAAASYLVDRLGDAAVMASIDVFSDQTPEGSMVFRNVLAEFPARDSAFLPGRSLSSFLTAESVGAIIALVSHYDTKGGIGDAFVGANDSGSSSGLLLEMARVLSEAPSLPCHVLLAFVDGEECQTSYGPNDGLHGSKRLARRLLSPRVRERFLGVIVVDMIGDADLKVAIPRNCSASLVTTAFRAAKAVGARHHFALSRFDVIDDHVPFIQNGFRAVNLIDFEYGSAPGKNDYWHTEADTMDKLSAASLQIVGRTVIEMMNLMVEQGAPQADARR